jgi:hypothetical protein
MMIVIFLLAGSNPFFGVHLLHTRLPFSELPTTERSLRVRSLSLKEVLIDLLRRFDRRMPQPIPNVVHPGILLVQHPIRHGVSK